MTFPLVVDTGLVKQLVERNDPSPAKPTIYDAWTFEKNLIQTMQQR